MTAAAVIKLNIGVLSKKGAELYAALAVSAFLLIISFINMFSLERGEPLHHGLLCIFFAAIALISVMALLSSRDFSPVAFCVMMPAVIASIWLRFLFLDHLTQDYNYFLSGWMDFFRENGGFSAIKDSIGDYNMPYLYFLAFLSYFKMPDLYGIKLLSIAFDYLLAFFSMKLVRHLCNNKILADISFVAVPFIPTVLLNGSFWGQCDSIYAAFIAAALYLVLSNRPSASVIALALAFSFKLQTVFVMPLYLVLLFARRLRIRHLFVFPAVFFAALIPALLLGKPLRDTLVIYLNQTGTYSSRLTLNAPSIFALLPEQEGPAVKYWAAFGIVLAAVFVIAVCIYLFIYRKTLSRLTLFTAALLFATGIPLLLPHMHDRYFYIADVLSLLYAMIKPGRIAVPFLTILASCGAYHAYLRLEYLFPMKLGAFMLIISALVLLFDIVQEQKHITE